MKKERLEVIDETTSYQLATGKTILLVGEDSGKVFLNFHSADSDARRKANWIAHCVNEQLERASQI